MILTFDNGLKMESDGLALQMAIVFDLVKAGI